MFSEEEDVECFFGLFFWDFFYVECLTVWTADGFSLLRLACGSDLFLMFTYNEGHIL